jgi:hypothetical protein
MSWWEWFFNTAAGAASLMSLILGGILGVVSWRISRSTDKLITHGRDSTHALIKEMHADTQRTLAQMDERTTRMNELAEERHREVIQAIQALKS